MKQRQYNSKNIWFLMFILGVFFLLVPSQIVYADNNSINSAKEITFGTVYNESITSSVNNRFYKLTLSNSGIVDFKIEGDNGSITFYLYDNTDGKYMQLEYRTKNYDINKTIITNSYYLTKGIYYMQVSGGTYNSTGNYTIRIDYQGVSETFVESGNGTNNDMPSANAIGVNQQINGFIAMNDKDDYYKFSIDTGKINVVADSALKYLSVDLYDMNGTKIYSNSAKKNTVTNRSSISENWYLQKGQYYVRVHDNPDVTWFNYSPERYGDYSFTLNYATANESFAESGADDTIQGANYIQYDTGYNGQLSKNHDDKDYYVFSVSGSNIIAIDFCSEMTKGTINIYDPSGSSKASVGFNNIANISKTDILNLVDGTYYLCVSSDNQRGNYTFKVRTITNPQKANISSVKSKKKKKVILKWNKINDVNGYQIEYSNKKNFKNSKKTIVNGTSKTIKGLKSKKRYYFRVRAYRYVAGNLFYGSWSNRKSIKVK